MHRCRISLVINDCWIDSNVNSCAVGLFESLNHYSKPPGQLLILYASVCLTSVLLLVVFCRDAVTSGSPDRSFKRRCSAPGRSSSTTRSTTATSTFSPICSRSNGAASNPISANSTTLLGRSTPVLATEVLS